MKKTDDKTNELTDSEKLDVIMDELRILNLNFDVLISHLGLDMSRGMEALSHIKAARDRRPNARTMRMSNYQGKAR